MLKLTNISKSFDGFPALTDASFSVEAGQVHALLGENGAGKSSLMNVVAGLYRPDAGAIFIDGREVTINGPLDAKRIGIGMVHQHYKLVDAFDTVENIALATGSRISDGEIRRRSDSLGFEVDLRAPVATLSVAEQQRVEILKALVGGARIVILDEPSAVLTDKEAASLLQTMRQLAAQGAAVVLVTHKLSEVLSFADRVTVMRGGRTIASTDPADHSPASLTSLVVGEIVEEKREPGREPGDVMLTLNGVAARRSDGHMPLIDASLTVRAGEIYGIAGVGGNGQAELAEILMGVRRPSAGSIQAGDGLDLTMDEAGRRRDMGIVSIPANRQKYALAGELSIVDNFGVHGIRSGAFGKWWRVDRRLAQQRAADAVAAAEVHGVRSLHQKASLLSGGNAQKLVIAREFSSQPRIVMAHSPSRGLDVRASAAVHQRLRDARDAGAGVLLISEDLDEIMLLSDRIGVMTSGRIVREFKAPADRQAIGRAMVHHD